MADPTPVDDLIEEWRIHDGWRMSKADVEVLIAEIEAQRSVIARLRAGWDPVHSVGPAKLHSWVRPEAFTHQVVYEPLTPAELAVVDPGCSFDWPCACGIGAPDA